MRDIPIFTTENGVASLFLKKIAYTGQAYIVIRDSRSPKAFLDECVAFCLSAGASRVYASGDPSLSEYPMHTQMIKLSRTRSGLPESDAEIAAIEETELTQWRKDYNARMLPVDNSAPMTMEDARKHLGDGDAYYIRKDGKKIGLGIASGEQIDTLISLVPGMGQTVLLALNQVLTGTDIYLTVASTNQRALRLYEKLGFAKIGIISDWYAVK